MSKIKRSNRIKKVCGNSLSNFLVRNFDDKWACDTIERIFANKGRDSQHIPESEFPKLKRILSQIEAKERNPEVANEVVQQPLPEELLKSVGYSLHKTETYEDTLKFKKYFRKNEELCKFDDSTRAKRYHIYWIVKDNASDIKPLETPDRQDEYSTSVCSIQINKSGDSVTQITSRYNHSVGGCDNTFNSNLDNIVDGLKDSFNQHFEYEIKNSSQEELTSFVHMKGKFAYYNQEINGIKFGNNVIIDNEIKEYSKDDYYLYDYFLINLRTKKIEWDEQVMGYMDDFVRVFNESVKRIEFVKDIKKVDDGDSDEVCYIQK
jgi:hypothetical protein